MKTFVLFCRVFYGAVVPDFTTTEAKILESCDKPFKTVTLCQVEEAKVKFIKHKDVTILTSCGPAS